ncbi:MFS general substrate transporter [Mycena maculata]|uniref:MFS general substrate transporter n=1 Tax=Mycena maculata TaxID=230809 RepID=A0AAD7MZJ0_9AGAR|nr:MFS general substrate transporter [Mycena maculata]
MSAGEKSTKYSLEKVEDSQIADVKLKSSSEEDLDFGGDSTLPPPPTLSTEEERKLWRKIDLKLVPILTLMYLASFLDRGNIGNAKLDGLETQLNLVGNEYNIALTMFFIPYCLFECPANLVLKRFRPSKWLPSITLVWGIVMTLMGFVKTYPQLVGVRICLGVAEAGLFPGVVYYLSLWYPRHMLQLRIGLFYSAASMAGAFSGLLAYGIDFMNGTRGLLGWSWIFILEGIATVCVGILAFFVLVDFPSTAGFLTLEERSFVVWRKKYDNSSVGEEEHFEKRHLVQAFTDWQVWLHILVYFSIVGPLYGITLFLPTIIKSFGHSVPVSQLLTVPPYVFATIVLLNSAYWSDRIKKRSPFILAGLFMCLIGFSINISNAPSGVKYFGVFFCVGGAYSAFPGVVAWLGNNLSGQYKRGVGMALHIGIGNFSGAIASNIYRSQDEPRYLVGHGCELMFVGIGLITLPIVVLMYKRINARRDEAAAALLERGEINMYTRKELREMGDRAPDFRYTL